MNRIISLAMSNQTETKGNKMYGIVFSNNQIEDFLFVPSDYTIEEFSNIILGYYSPISTTIIIDKNGIGIYLKELFESKDIKHTLPSNRDKIGIVLNQARDEIINLAMNSNFDVISKIEFKKLIGELDNIEIEMKNGLCRLTTKDKEKSINRALCYLQYLSITKNTLL
jgi:hypothetical protein